MSQRFIEVILEPMYKIFPQIVGDRDKDVGADVDVSLPILCYEFGIQLTNESMNRFHVKKIKKFTKILSKKKIHFQFCRKPIFTIW